jgi:monoamine oxidase
MAILPANNPSAHQLASRSFLSVPARMQAGYTLGFSRSNLRYDSSWERKDMSEILDYAVVGGGCAGTYIAWRLSTAPGKRSVHLYEADRIGGRLLTLKLSGNGDTPIELGGMRYSPNQVLISNLLPELKLKSRKFDYPMRFLYLRNQRFLPGSSPPYHLDADESSKDAVELIRLGIRKALQNLSFESSSSRDQVKSLKAKLGSLRKNPDWPRFSQLKAKEWGLLKRYGHVGNTALYEIGFWNLLHAFLSSEAYFFSHDGLGYQSVLANWNSAEAIPWFLRDFESPKYRSIIGGMDQLPARLAHSFEHEGGGFRQVEHRLTRIEMPSNEDKPFLLTLDTEAGNKVVQARHVVLALPKEALKRIEFGGLKKHQVNRWRHDLDAVRGNPLFKLFLAYKTPWWQQRYERALAPGRAVTDLPIRQVYYYSAHDSKIARADSGRGEPLALLMASYSDARYVDFWKPVLRRGGQDAYHRDVELSAEDLDILAPFGASERMVRKAHRQVVNLHVNRYEDRNAIPEPCLGLVMDWSRPPFYAGWHTWEPRRRSWFVRPRMRQPFAPARVYVCGEAFSCEQGWVEGALRSAEMVLKRLGFGPPKWVPSKAYESANFESYEDYVEGI